MVPIKIEDGRNKYSDDMTDIREKTHSSIHGT